MTLKVAAHFTRPDGTTGTDYASAETPEEARAAGEHYALYGVSELVVGVLTYYPSNAIQKVTVEQA
jgi:hypothetical protein